MNILICDGNDRYATIVECPKEICDNFYAYLNDYINSAQYKHTWGVEELINYINKTKPSNLRDLKIIDLYTDKYDKDSPRFNI